MTRTHKGPCSGAMLLQEINKFYVVFNQFSSSLSEIPRVEVIRCVQAMYNNHRHLIAMKKGQARCKLFQLKEENKELAVTTETLSACILKTKVELNASPQRICCGMQNQSKGQNASGRNN